MPPPTPWLVRAAADCSIHEGAELLAIGASDPTAVYDICQKTYFSMTSTNLLIIHIIRS